MFFVFQLSFSQVKDTLFTVNKTPVSSSEFMYMYHKNSSLIQETAKNDMDTYLDLYIKYKLKLIAALEMKLDEGRSYKNEFKTYRNQLAERYLTDNRVNDSLLNEAYFRTINEVSVNHILVKVAPGAKAKDTLKAYQKIMTYREKALQVGFENIMKTVHDGTMVYGESLGYFNAFRMVYPFENASYSSSVGDISMPFKTRFGYHIIKVVDKRPSKGAVSVAHIMIADKSKTLTTTSKTKIDDIYQKLQDGGDFTKLALQFSDDRQSAKKGGKLASFENHNEKSFENTAFSLIDEGEFSKPIKTSYGWHILKLIKKHPVANFETLKSTLVNKIKNDMRSKVSDDAFYLKLKKQYHYKTVSGAIQEMEAVVTDDFISGKWSPDTKKGNTYFAYFANQKLSYNTYYVYLQSRLKNKSSISNKKALISEVLSEFVNKEIYRYHGENLEITYPEFGALVKEYKDGLLLFELMEKKIWEPSKSDSTALRQYYKDNADKYFSERQFEAVVVTSDTRKMAAKVRSLLKQETPIELLKKEYHNAVFSKGIFEESDKEIPKAFRLRKGVSKVMKHHSHYVVVMVTKKTPPVLKPFDSVKGFVIGDYQKELEEKWLVLLREKYPVYINNKVFSQLKKQYDE